MAVQPASEFKQPSGPSGFDHYWGTKGEWVEEPNRRRGGESGVQRVFLGNDHLIM